MTVDLVALAHNSENAEAFEAGTLGLLGQAVGFDAAFFLVKGYEDVITTLGLNANAPAQLAKHGARYAQDLLPVKRAALAARGAPLPQSFARQIEFALYTTMNECSGDDCQAVARGSASTEGL